MIWVNVRWGTGVPLVLCNGIGASLEVLDPLVRAAGFGYHGGQIRRAGNRRIAHIPCCPTGFPYLAWVLGRVLSKLGIGVVDVLGLSWGGALAQQFAFQNPRRCRRLVLVATGTGALMVPAHPRDTGENGYAAHGSRIRTTPRLLPVSYTAALSARTGKMWRDYFVQQLHAGSKMGYLHQLLAGSVWSSLFALPAVRQQTLIVAGTDDPIIPVVNAHIMNALLPHSRLHQHSGGHIDLVHNAIELVPVIETFLREQP